MSSDISWTVQAMIILAIVSFEIGVLELGVREASGWARDTTREGMAMSKQKRGSDEAAEKSIFFLQSWKECHRLREQWDKQRGSKLQAI